MRQKSVIMVIQSAGWRSFYKAAMLLQSIEIFSVPLSLPIIEEIINGMQQHKLFFLYRSNLVRSKDILPITVKNSTILNQIVSPDLSSVSNGLTSESNWCSLLEMNLFLLRNTKKLYSNGTTFCREIFSCKPKLGKKSCLAISQVPKKREARLD